MFFFCRGNRFELCGHAKPTSYKPSFSPSSSSFVYLFLSLFITFSVPSSDFFPPQKELGKRSLVLASCLLFILALFLTCSVRSFFPSPSFHPPVRFPPCLSLISSRCVSCIPLVRAEGEGSLKRRREKREAWRARGKRERERDALNESST